MTLCKNSFVEAMMSGSDHNKNGGGIAWAGSLVGATNPNNLGFRYSHAHKRYKKSTDENETNDDELPSSLVIQFQNREGTTVGGQMDVPTESDVDALGSLVHAILHENEENGEDKRIPYSFYAKVLRNGVEDDLEVTTTLAAFIREHKISTEQILELTYQPLAVFRVRPVTRCTDTMPGHTEAILHVSYSPDGKSLLQYNMDQLQINIIYFLVCGNLC